MAAKTDVAGRRVAKKGEAPLARYAEKDITPVTQDYINWLEEQTGVKVDPMSVQLASVLRGPFQKSEGNQERIAAAKQRKIDEAEARATRAAERAEKKAAQEAARAAKATEPKAEKVTKTATAKAAPAKAAPAARKAVAAKTPAKAAPATARRRPARAAKEADADF